jgi:hypothetical protein
MNEHLINWIWNYSKLQSPKQILVMLAMAHYANSSGESTVKLAELVRLTRLDENNVREAIRAAVRIKELAIFENYEPSQGRRVTNTYRFMVFAGPRQDKKNGAEEDIQFDEPQGSLPGIDVPKVRDLPKPTQPKIMMDAAQLEIISADPLYRGLDVKTQAWKFKRWCRAQVPPAEETVRRFKVWLSKV